VNRANDDEPMLDEAAIRAATDAHLEKYRGLGTFERFAMFMGIVQLLELGLKNLLIRRFGVDAETLEKATLGQVKGRLQDNGVRPDFIALLENVVARRNHMAHGFMADAAMTRAMFGKETRFETAELDKGILELANLAVIFEWTEANDAWGVD